MKIINPEPMTTDGNGIYEFNRERLKKLKSKPTLFSILQGLPNLSGSWMIIDDIHEDTEDIDYKIVEQLQLPKPE